MASTPWEALQRWYLSQCDEDWEHSYGIRVETLDNPGWIITVDLVDTGLEDRPFEPRVIERTEHDWIHCKRIDGPKWQGAGGPLNLDELVRTFLDWAGVAHGPS